MRKKWKRYISFLVSASMAVGMMPVAAFAKTMETPGGNNVSVMGNAMTEDVLSDNEQTIDPYDLKNATVSVSSNVPLVDGKATLNITVTDYSGKVLSPDTDYKLEFGFDGMTYDRICEYGYHSVRVLPGENGIYTGENSRSGFEVYDPYALSNKWTGSFSPSDKVMSGSAQLPTPVIRSTEDNVLSEELTENTDFELDHISGWDEISHAYIDYGKTIPEKWGLYYAYYKGLGKYKYMCSIAFSVIDPYDLECTWKNDYGGTEYYWDYVFKESNRICSGSSKLPVLEVYHWNDSTRITLKENADFELDHITYENGELYGNEIPTEAGLYYAYYKGIGKYTGSISAQFEVYDPHDLGYMDEYRKYWSGSFSTEGCIELGATALPVPVICHIDYDHGNTYLEEGRDFELDHILQDTDEDDPQDYGLVIPQEVGNYYAYYKGKGDYTGFLSIHFSVCDPHDLGGMYGDNLFTNYWCASYPNGGWLEIGTTQLPTVSIYHEDDYSGDVTTLVEGSDYELDHIEKYDYINDTAEECGKEMPQQAGFYRVYYKGKGAYRGSVIAGFSIYDKHDLGCEIINQHYWTGKLSSNGVVELGAEKLPEVSIYSDYDYNHEVGDIVTLVEGTDYVFDHISDGDEDYGQTVPSKAGTYFAYYRGLGAYGGMCAVRFSVMDIRDLSCEIDYSRYWFAEYITTDAVKKGADKLPDLSICHETDDGSKTTLVEGTDFELDHISFDGEDCGKAVPSEPGEYEACYKGKGDYKGTISVSFEVFDPYDLESIVHLSRYWIGGFVPSNAVILGDTSLPKPEVYCWADGRTKEYLVEGTDYEFDRVEDSFGEKVEGDIPTSLGEYYAYYHGLGDYRGEISIRFTVFPANDIGNKHWKATFEGGNVFYGYNFNFTQPELILESEDGEKVLVRGRDYEFVRYDDEYVEYDDHSKPDESGYYLAVYQGIGAYTGELKVQFRLDDAYDLSGAKMTLKDNSYSFTGNAVDLKASVIDPMGAELDPVKDYELVFLNSEKKELSGGAPVEAGDYYVYAKALSGSKYYDKTDCCSFSIVDCTPAVVDISKATVTLGAKQYTYDGKVKDPKVTSVVVDGKTLVEGVDYTVTTPAGRKNVDTYTYTVTGQGDYEGTAKASFTINRATSKIAIVAQSKVYTGKALTYTGKVTKSGSTGEVTYVFYSDAKGTKTVKLTDVKNAKTYYVKANLAADTNYKAASSKLVKFTITKAKNTLKATGKKKTVKFKTVKKKAQTIACITVTKAKGKVTYTLTSVAKKKFKKYFKVNAKTGKVTLKKGTPKGTHTLKIKVTAKGNVNYKAGSKTIAVKVVVK